MDKVATEKHLKQNKEIIRINQAQSNRIVALETEITKLLSENIQLRTQVIQLNHRQDITAQKAHLERKVREIHRLIRGLGTANSAVPASPVPAVLRKSPKKTNLSTINPECSPDRSTLDFISARSKPRSLNAGPSRVSCSASFGEENMQFATTSVLDEDATSLSRANSPESTERTEQEVSQERLDRARDREVRRSSRRVSRSSGEIVPLQPQDLERSETVARERESHSLQEVKSHRRRSRSSAMYDSAPLATTIDDDSQVAEKHRSSDNERVLPSLDLYNEDKENAPSQRGSNAALRLLHSSPVKSRTALNLIADPLPSLNIQPVVQQTPIKTVAEVTEVKLEPESPMLKREAIARDVGDSGNRAEGSVEESGRSRRGKSVNYAEPSLRVKMRRTESLPGDKRRKSSYRRSSSVIDRPSSSRGTITIDED